LQPFTEQDSRYFFGRKRDQQIIISNLYASPLTVLYGASGVGKSSVLMAGVVPQLKKASRLAAGNAASVAPDDGGDDPDADDIEQTPPVVVVFRRWQDEDFLAELRDEVRLALSTQARVELEENSGDALDEFLGQAARRLGAPIFFILDQFEEYFLYHPAQPPEDDAGFEAQFVRAVNRRDVNVNFLLSIREDGISKLDRFQGRIPTLLNNMLRLEHLTRVSAGEAIRLPLEEHNRHLPEDQTPYTIEPELVAALLDDLALGGNSTQQQPAQGVVADRAQPAGGRIETPFLQMVMMRLWMQETAANSRALRLHTYESLGRTKKIASTHLDRVMDKLSAQERRMAARMLQYLVTPSGTKIAQTLPDLAISSNFPEPALEALLRKLSGGQTRILRVVEPPANQPTLPRYEIFHDVLAQPILGWRAQFIRRQGRRWRYGVMVLSGVVALMVVLLVLAVKHGIDRAKRAARSGELAAYAKSQLTHDPELSLLLSLESAKAERTSKAEGALRKSLLAAHLKTLLLHDKPIAIRGIAYSPDGKYVATAGWSEAGKNEARVWNAATGEVVSYLQETTRPVISVSFSPDGKYVLTAGQDGTARVWTDWQRGAPRVEAAIVEQQEIRAAAFSPHDGQYIVTGGSDGIVRVWDWQTEEGRTKPFKQIIFADWKESPTPSPTPTSSPGTGVTPATGRATAPATSAATSQTTTPSPVAAAAPTSSSPASGSATPAASPTPAQGRGPTIYSAAFSPDGQHIVIAGKSLFVRVWTWRAEPGRNNPLKLEKGHRDLIHSARFSPDGKYVVTGSDDATTIVWEWQAAKPLDSAIVLRGPLTSVRGVAFSDDGRLVATASADGVARLWDWRAEAAKDFSARRPFLELHGHAAASYCVAFSPDNQMVATGSEDGSARIWMRQVPSVEGLSLDQLIETAEARLTRNLTPDEQRIFMEESDGK
jgi:WD40 repeat protein